MKEDYWQQECQSGPQLNSSAQRTTLGNVTPAAEKKVAEFRLGKVVTSVQWVLLLLMPVHNDNPFVTYQL